VTKNSVLVDALIVASFLLLVGRHPGFQQRYGGGYQTPEQAVIHAIENESESLPSYACLANPQRQLVLAVFQAYFPMEMLLNTEVVPSHFARVKDLLVPKENGLDFFQTVLAIEHIVRCRTVVISDANVEFVSLGAQCLASVTKYNGPRAYELLLKRRGAAHNMRLVRDDFLNRAIIRLCCFRGIEEDEAWAEMPNLVQELGDRETRALQVEIGQKDGLAEVPAYVPCGAAALMQAGTTNADVGVKSAVIALCRVLDEAVVSFGKVLNYKVVKLRLENLAVRASQYKAGSGPPFADLPFQLEEIGAGEVAVKVLG